jgi:putative ABC transport system substrate-binding protein
MRRRDFMAWLGGAAVAWPFAACAQAAPARPLVGLLSPLSAATAARNMEAFHAGLRQVGYVDGRNIALELRFAGGSAERMAQLAAELVAIKPAIIVAGSTPAALAVHNATRTIPIIVGMNRDPVELGLAAGISRPGGNVTGFWIEGDETMIAKRLELLKEAVPGISRVAALINPDDMADKGAFTSLPAAIGTLGLTVRVFEARSLADVETTVATAVRDGMQALHVSQSPLFNNYRSEIAGMALRARLPSIFSFREFATAGGLMSYATSLPAVYWRFGALVDKVLKGAKPADLPIERPSRFELVVNLRTAKALGLTIPESFLLRVDDVIEE